MPMWNEARRIEEVLAELERDVVVGFEGRVMVTVVDDASTDGSGAILDRLAERPWLTVVHAPANRGHGPSVRDGLDRAGGEWIFVVDSDGHLPLGDFWRLWQARESADLVLGVRAGRGDPLHRLVLTRAVRLVTSALAGRRIADANVPFRLMRRELWLDLRRFIPEDALAPSIMVALGAAVRGRRIVQVPVEWRSRPGGRSSLRRARLLAFSARGLLELLAFRVRLARAGQ
jgi:glycosyltransferase involved in cell wall biosynthesis